MFLACVVHNFSSSAVIKFIMCFHSFLSAPLPPTKHVKVFLVILVPQDGNFAVDYMSISGIERALPYPINLVLKIDEVTTTERKRDENF